MNSKFADRRKHSRAPVRIEIYCEELKGRDKKGAGIVSFYSTDISLGGIFLETDVSFKIGDILHLQFILPKLKETLKLNGIVVRATGSRDDQLPGIGLAFENLSYDDKRIIEGYVIDEIADQL
ncbi:MAG: PilZ domain-containing protein [bacterium]